MSTTGPVDRADHPGTPARSSHRRSTAASEDHAATAPAPRRRRTGAGVRRLVLHRRRGTVRRGGRQATGHRDEQDILELIAEERDRLGTRLGADRRAVAVRMDELVVADTLAHRATVRAGDQLQVPQRVSGGAVLSSASPHRSRTDVDARRRWPGRGSPRIDGAIRNPARTRSSRHRVTRHRRANIRVGDRRTYASSRSGYSGTLAARGSSARLSWPRRWTGPSRRSASTRGSTGSFAGSSCTGMLVERVALREECVPTRESGRSARSGLDRCRAPAEETTFSSSITEPRSVGP